MDGYSFKGVYDLTNAQLHHFNIFFEYNQLTSTYSNVTNVIMHGNYRGSFFSSTVAILQNAASISFGPGSNGTFSILDKNSNELWRSNRLPVCKYLPDYRYTTLSMESYAPFVGLYNEAGQLLWKFGQMTDCSFT